MTVSHDHNGNLKQTYGPWNRLVKVTASNDTNVTIQTAVYDGKGHRLKKVVTNSADHNGTVLYLI